MDSQDTLQYQINIPERMMIFIDARNIYEAEKEYNLRAEQHFVLGYKEMINFFAKKYKVIRGYFYDGAPHPSQRTPEREQFFRDLRQNGITLRLKEIDFTAISKPSQKGVDIFLTADMISLAYENAYDIAVILSGDGDYVALIDLVKSKGKKVWVLSFDSALSPKLRECADKVLVIDRMLDVFGKQRLIKPDMPNQNKQKADKKSENLINNKTPHT